MGLGDPPGSATVSKKKIESYITYHCCQSKQCQRPYIAKVHAGNGDDTYTWISGVETIKTKHWGNVRLYGCRPKSVGARLDCGLGWTPAPSVTYNAAEVAYAACESYVNLYSNSCVQCTLAHRCGGREQMNPLWVRAWDGALLESLHTCPLQTCYATEWNPSLPLYCEHVGTLHVIIKSLPHPRA